MKTNIIYNNDCIKTLNTKIDKNSIDLIFADPPYNLSGNGLKWQGNKTGGDWYMVNEHWDKMTSSEYMQFSKKWISSCSKVLKNTGSIYIACSYHNIGEMMMILKKLNFKINNIITWYKTNSMPNMTKRIFTHSTEFIIWAVKGKGWTFNYEMLKDINPEKQKNGDKKQMRDFWQIPLVQGCERIKGYDGKALHPTQKPEEMLKRIILASSNKGDIVLDPFSGSGTTIFIARKYERNWIGIENNNNYVKISKQRMQKIKIVEIKLKSNMLEIKEKSKQNQKSKEIKKISIT